VSPRSKEFLEQAKDRLADAQTILNTAHPAVVVSAAYYGMLYAARAALSERGEYAKTHSGTWTLFSQVFVAPGEFDQGKAVWSAFRYFNNFLNFPHFRALAMSSAVSQARRAVATA
jgi:uncharacterized protein (UPF0332 family)